VTKFALLLASLGALLACIVTFGPTRGQQGKVISSEHDLGVASTSGVSACEVCHLPHDLGGESLWAQSPYPEDDFFSGSAPLCYSCHDGTVAAGGAYVFDTGLAQHPVTPGEAGEDCDMCHDAHVPDYGEFLLFSTGANHCRTCHANADDGNHPLNVDAVGHGYPPWDDRWNPNDGDFSGTRLWDMSGWQAGDHVKCLSCHAAHGTLTDTMLLTMRLEEVPGSGALCGNCHRESEAR
jgi:predicted CXXCH cytochrome family protein